MGGILTAGGWVRVAWGLKVERERKLPHVLLFREDIEKSDWLGAVLAERFGVPFQPAENRGDDDE